MAISWENLKLASNLKQTYPCKHQSTVQVQITHARLQNERNMKVKQLVMKIKGSRGSTKFS